MIARILFHLRSAQDNVRKNVGIPNCLTIAKTSDLNLFREAGVPLIVFVKLNAWSLAKTSLSVSLNLTLLKLHAFNTPSHLSHCNVNLLLQAHILQNISSKKNII